MTRTKRLVVKVGSRLLVSEDGKPDDGKIDGLVDQLESLHRGGMEVVLVSSGAIACGMDVLGKSCRPSKLSELQMAAAVGQVRLMSRYKRFFLRRGVHIAQVLLTREDLNDRTRHLNARNSMEAIIRQGIIPVVNENDAISTDEIKLGDNDILASLVSLLVSADALVLLTTVNGFRLRGAGGALETKRLAFSCGVDESLFENVRGKGSEFSIGGMATKLQAAGVANKAGVPVVIADGSSKSILRDICEGKDVGTLFFPPSGDSSLKRNKKRWLAFFHRPVGSIVIDDGACAAIGQNGNSLLPVGVVGVEGTFDVGSLVDVVAVSGNLVARGLSEYSSAAIREIMGKGTREISEMFEDKQPEEVIHRDNMVLMSEYKGDLV